MKIAVFLMAAAPLFAGDLEHFTDSKLNQAQRSEACLRLRGNRSPEVIAAMHAALSDAGVQGCAAANLRMAGATGELLGALADANPMVRAVAVRELGAAEDPRFLPALREAVEDRDLLVQGNAIQALVQYRDHSSAPQLRETALLGGILTTLSLDALMEWHDPAVLPIARKLISRKEPGDLLAGIRALGLAGEAEDLPPLREFLKDGAAVSAGGRGFGFLPAISIARAARTAIARIEERAGR